MRELVGRRHRTDAVERVARRGAEHVVDAEIEIGLRRRVEERLAERRQHRPVTVGVARERREVRRDARVALCFEEGYSYVTVTGRVRLIEEQAVAQADIRHLALRYDGSERAEQQPPTLEQLLDDDAAIANVLKHATTLAGFHSPYFLDGVNFSYTPDDYTPMKTLFISEFNGKDWDISDKPVTE